MKLYGRYLLILLRSQMQYRASFWLLFTGQFIQPLVTLGGLYLLFDRFGQLQGWVFYEVAICFAIIYMAFGLCECFFRGFDTFSSLVVSGLFDRLLVRPRSTILQVMGSRFEFNRTGKLLQSLIVLIWALTQMPIAWSGLKILTLLLMIASGVGIFSGLFLLGATLCFWTIQGLEVSNILTDGGKEVAQYPLNIYPKWVMHFFTFVIPYSTMNYLPLMYLLDKTQTDSDLYVLLPLTGILFLLPCLLIWNWGVKHYLSTGS